jgi:uncharacterized protein DUF6352
VKQDFWASSGFSLLERRGASLWATPAWLARFLQRDELVLPDEAGPRERELHAQVLADPMSPVTGAMLAVLEDADARENWTEFVRFRERVAAASLEDVYRDLFRRPAVDLAPAFVDALAQAIVHGLLEATPDAWLCRAGEMFFRLQRVSTEGGQALAADAATLEAFAQTGGFGNVGRLLRAQNTELPRVKMDVLNAENAPFYFMRDELYSFALDLTPGREGARALAAILALWVRHMAGADVTIEPAGRVEDPQWRWHAGLDVDSTVILNALYRGDEVPPADLGRMVALFRLEFRDPAQVQADVRGRPVYLGLACRPDRTLRMKPQNLLTNLPLAAAR